MKTDQMAFLETPACPHRLLYLYGHLPIPTYYAINKQRDRKHLNCNSSESFLMLCSSSARFLTCRNLTTVSAISAYASLPLYSPSKKTHLASFSNSSSFLRTGFPCFASFPVFASSKPLLCISRSNSTMASPSAQSVHDFTVKDARGNDVDLSKYKGKVLLIVNVASQCGLTNSNYTELAQLYGKYKDQGLEILAFPCNQFGGQEPGTNEQILETACTRFKAEYPIFDKVDVNGANAAPIYNFLKSSKGSLFGDGIKWNFSKFLVDKDGHVVDRYAPTTSPLSIEKDVKKLLGVK